MNKKEELRPCTFKKKVRIDGEVWPNNIKEIQIAGLFHCWSQESDSDSGVSTVAVVECVDGSIELALAENVRFLD
jgi:hypothetical protein